MSETTSKATYRLIEVMEFTGLERGEIAVYIENQWIQPCERQGIEIRFDDEDVARIHLIEELRRDFEINDEAIPLVLHLIDQIHALRSRLR